MNEDVWSAADSYLAAALLPGDPVLDAVLAANSAAGLPSIDVSPLFGKLLHLLARIRGARSILEIGTLGGYSTIWLARALPADGRLITLEANPLHAETARANLSRAGVEHLVELRLGDARESLQQLANEDRGPFDFIFIDADKPGNPEYLQWSVKLSLPGTLIVVDNVVRGGAVAEADSNDPAVLGVRRMNELIAADPRLTATAIQTVGSKGHDGFLLAHVQDVA